MGWHPNLWPPEHVEALRALAGPHKRAREIAAELNKQFGTHYSKNAIIGKINRVMGKGVLEHKSQPLTPDKIAARKERRNARLRLARKIAPYHQRDRRTEPMQIKFDDDLQIPVAQRKQLIELDTNGQRH